MLKQRVITAVILASIVVSTVLWASVEGFALLFGLIVLLAAWEWGMLLGQGQYGAVGFTGLILLLLAGVWIQHHNAAQLSFLLLLAALFWLAVLLWMYRFIRNPQQHASAWILLPVGLILLVPPWWALLALRESSQWGSAYVLYLLVLIWVADIGAYFVGRTYGRRKLALLISPGKTWEGALGGLVTALALAFLGAWLLGVSSTAWPEFVLLSIVVIIFSIVGDLFESMIKRQSGVKDSSRILPGHGGVLDRVDSLTAAAPLFVLGLFWLNGLIQ